MLPVHLTGFIGRDREVADVTTLVQGGGTRMLTLTGAGGSGKTRLATEVAAHVAGFARVVWVDLAPITDAELLVPTIATALGLADRASTTPLRTVIDAICGTRVLLVLDNCEHVVVPVAEVVDALLRGCPQVVVLATSREALGVPSETAWLVPPMGTPDASRLFTERAQAALPSFKLSPGNQAAVEEICRRLDGIPLAIELAAARARVLSPDQIVSRLNDVFKLLSSGTRTALPRHRTLRATMEWSFNLLGAREQLLLRRLSVFAGTFDLNAVERVCTGDSLDTDDILDVLAALVDKSLVVMEADEGDVRYRLLETVRQYGRERLDDTHELDAIELRHAEYYLAVLDTVAPQLVGGAMSITIIEQLALDHDNLRGAIAWATSDPGRAELALRFIGGMFWFWYARGQFREARQLTDRALALKGPAGDLHRGRAEVSAGLIALAQGDYARSESHFDRAIALLRETSDHAVAVAMAKRGAAVLLGGDLSRASKMLDEALEVARRWPRPDVAIVFAEFWGGWAAYRRGDLDTARALMDDIVNEARFHGLPVSLAHALVTLSRIEMAQGDLEDACRDLLEGLELEVSLKDGWGIALGLDSAAFIAARRGRHEDAARILGANSAHRERIAVALSVLSPREDDALDGKLRSALGSRYETLYAEGRSLTTREVVGMAMAEAARHTAEHRVISLTTQAVAPPKRLRVLALGPLQVFVGDRQIEANAWGSARPRELLIYLLMHPDGRTKEHVGLAFWPEASAAQLRNSFHVTLHRLRKALGGAEWVKLEGERYVVEQALVKEFDAMAFEKEVKEATRALAKDQGGTSAALDKALSRYRGDFLDGEPVGDWHLEHRDRLQKTYLDALMLLGARLEVEERHAKAAEVYGRVLARDELHEEAVLALMRVHVALGERSVALRLYQRFATRMRTELDAEPGRETSRFASEVKGV